MYYIHVVTFFCIVFERLHILVLKEGTCDQIFRSKTAHLSLATKKQMRTVSTDEAALRQGGGAIGKVRLQMFRFSCGKFAKICLKHSRAGS